MEVLDKPLADGKHVELMRQARNASNLMKALSHETRLIILCLLLEGEKSVSELEAQLDMPQASVSQQLARLRFDRLVKTRRQGRIIHYSIANDGIATIIGALHQMFCKDRSEADWKA